MNAYLVPIYDGHTNDCIYIETIKARNYAHAKSILLNKLSKAAKLEDYEEIDLTDDEAVEQALFNFNYIIGDIKAIEEF